MKNAGHSSVYYYQGLSDIDLAWNRVHPTERASQAIMFELRSIRERRTHMVMARNRRRSDAVGQVFLDKIVANIVLSNAIAATITMSAFLGSCLTARAKKTKLASSAKRITACKVQMSRERHVHRLCENTQRVATYTWRKKLSFQLQIFYVLVFQK